MDISANQLTVKVVIDITQEELEELDQELNKVYKTLGCNVVYYSKLWELKDKINMAVNQYCH